MIKTMLEKRPIAVILLLLFFAVAAAVITVGIQEKAVEAAGNELGRTLVLDPGHGGFDGGAVSDDGTRESDLNLSIAGKTRLIAELLGQKTIMTRENDSARTDFASYSEHEDLVHRVKIINQTPGAVLMSIHQNTFPSSRPRGPQVLYASDDVSRQMGCFFQELLASCLLPESRRVAAPAGREIYILNHVRCPAILVECGFLSHPEEAAALEKAEYQKKLAVILAGGFLKFTGDESV